MVGNSFGEAADCLWQFGDLVVVVGVGFGVVTVGDGVGVVGGVVLDSAHVVEGVVGMGINVREFDFLRRVGEDLFLGAEHGVSWGIDFSNGGKRGGALGHRDGAGGGGGGRFFGD